MGQRPRRRSGSAIASAATGASFAARCGMAIVCLVAFPTVVAAQFRATTLSSAPPIITAPGPAQDGLGWRLPQRGSPYEGPAPNLVAPYNVETSPAEGPRGPEFPGGLTDGRTEMASRQNEFPTRFPSDPNSGYPPNLPLAVEDDQLLFEGPKITSFKEGFFQKASLAGTWIAGSSSADGLGIVESETFLTVAVPMPRREWPMLITPYLNVRTLDGPLSPDLPGVLYESYVDFMWVPKLTPKLLGILAVTPSVYSSFQTGSSDGFRWTGKGLLRWDVQPERLQILAGVLYLNREDVRVLPAGGIIWRPSSDNDFEFVFPRPKLAHRIRFTADTEDWIYLSGEFGGNSFAITRANGTPDVVTLRDWRVMLGLERRRNGGAGYRFEVGYVFSRSVEYFHSDTPDFTPDSTFMMRLVGTF